MRAGEGKKVAHEMAQWVKGLAALTTSAWFLGLMWWNERATSCKLSFHFTFMLGWYRHIYHMHRNYNISYAYLSHAYITLIHAYVTYTHIHTLINKQKNVI